jgi:hypothetical protein
MAGRWSFERLAGVGLDRHDLDEAASFVPDGHLHGELDAICPRCLRWIEEREFVRRTAYGPLQHEVCPEPLP